MMSSFKLSYYTMLNMLRRLEGSQHNMEYVIKNSFQQFQQERALPEVGGHSPRWLGRLHRSCSSPHHQSIWTLPPPSLPTVPLPLLVRVPTELPIFSGT